MIVAVRQPDPPSMEPEISEDLALVERAVSGDESAFQVLYERYADPLFAFIYHYLEHARPEAEEIWQDTLSAGLRGLRSYRGQSRFFSWLCSIARHKLADYWRRQGRTGQQLVSLPPVDLARLVDEGPLPGEVLNQQATRLRVIEALALLPTDYRTALVARYADGRSVAEVARSLGKSYKAAESILSRAKEAFRAALAEHMEMDL